MKWGKARKSEQREKNGKQKKYYKFQMKVLFAILVPVIVFCLISNIAISALLGYQLLEKKRAIEKGYLSVIDSQLAEIKSDLDVLALIAENNTRVRRILNKDALETAEEKKFAFDVQESLAASMGANGASEYLRHMRLVNRGGMQISITSVNRFVSAKEIFKSPVFQKEETKGKAKMGLALSVIDPQEVRLVYVYPLDLAKTSYLYMELDTQLFEEVLRPYRESADIFIQDETHKDWAWYTSESCRREYEQGKDSGKYNLSSKEAEGYGISMHVLSEKNLYSKDIKYITYVLLITVLLVLCLGMTISRMISTRITHPLQQLSAHINRMSVAKQTHITEDPSIEKGEDEVADIGRAFNMLVKHIHHLMKRQQEMYEQKQRLEMNALQAQINPHFLYNTLDSIRWMAVFQKAGNIADTVMSLENLLRNMAKGAGDKITLRKELELVQDYVNLQQVRYMEIFDYVCDIPEEYMECRIVKMTLQPIIENAILHGIVPTGTYGEIRVGLREQEEELYISIEDNGTGIAGEDFEKLVKTKKSKNAMSGIGIINVDERLRMTYGESYGLIYEGEKDKFTRVTIHIPKQTGEKADV